MSADSQPTHWLAPLADPPPPLPPPTPKPPFSLLALLALIGGLTIPTLACVGSLMLMTTFYANPTLPTLVSLLLAVALPGVPLVWQAWRRLQGQVSTPWQAHWWWIIVGLIGLLLVITLGQILIGYNLLPSLVAALTQPLVFILASVVILTLAAGGWTGLSRLRVWSHFVSGAWVAVAFSFVAEIVMIGGLAFIVLIVWASVAPEQVQPLIQMLRSRPDQIDQQVILDLLRRPWVIALAYLVASIIIPLIEELAKSVGVMALVGQRPAPMNAFLGGLLGGLGFGFAESLTNLVNLQDPWFVLVVARLGTLVMHGFTSSLVGWGWGQLAQGKPGRLALAFLGAVTIHGTWNAAVVTIVFAGLYFTDNPSATSPLTILMGLWVGLCVLTLILLIPFCLGGLMWVGYRLRTRAATP